MDHVGRAKPQQSRSRDKYERILDAAAEMFATVGVRDTQMTALAGAAGVSIGALYRLFTDLDEVAGALAARYTPLLMTELAQISVSDLVVFETAADQLVDVWLDFQDRHPAYGELLREYAGTGTRSAGGALFEALFPALVARLEPMFPPTDKDKVERVISNAFELVRYFLHKVPAADRADSVDEIKQMVVLYVCGRLRPDVPVRWPPPRPSS